MRTTRFLLAVVLLAGASPSAAQQTVNRRLALEPAGMFKFFASSGTVRVVGWDVDSVVVTGTISSKTQFFLGGGRTGAKGSAEGDGVEAMVDLTIRVPRRVRLWLRGGDADLHVEGTSGPLDCSSAAGSVRIQSTAPELTAETMGGDLVVIASPAYLRLRTATGRIEWTGASEDGALSTVSGRIVTQGAGFGRRGVIESITGDVQYRGGVGAGGAVTVDTHSGDVSLSLPKTTNATLSVSAVASDLFGLRSMGAPNRPASPIHKELGGATTGATITVRSFKGRVTASTP